MGKGFSQSEIARRCGVSRQAVNKVVKRLKEIWLAGRREIDCLNPVTNEIMEWDVLLGRVQELLAEGCPRADIATRLGVYRHTVDAMVQRLQR
jgi:DNA-binding transcriptional regulator LsrR (DeoR family)